MLNVSRSLYRILAVVVCLMFAEALAVPISAAAQAAGDPAPGPCPARLNSSAIR